MRIAIFGAGAVGAYFGGRLIAAKEHDVSLIARGEQLKALQSGGLRIESPTGDARIEPGEFLATDDPADVGPADVVFVTVKTWMVSEAAQALSPLIGDNTLVIPLQNGVEGPDQLLASLGERNVAGGTCRLFTTIVEPGFVRHTGPAPTIAIGELGAARTERVELVTGALAAAGVNATVSDDIRSALWQKLLFVGPLGGVGTVTRSAIGPIRSVPEPRRLLHACMNEIAAVAGAAGISLPEGAVETAMRFCDGLPADSTASMQRDIADGRPSELEAQVGVIVRKGIELGVQTPAHDVVYAALLPSELRARGQLS